MKYRPTDRTINKRCCTSKCVYPRHGAALFVVTIVVAMVSLSAYGFLFLMRTENQAARLHVDQLKVEQVAASGVEYLRSWMRKSAAERAVAGDLYDNRMLLHSVPVPAADQMVADADSSLRVPTFSLLAPGQNLTSPELIRFGVVSESSKIELQTLLQWERQQPGSGRDTLLKLPGMDERTADALLDWMDADDEAREFGAESQYYLSLTPPITPDNQVPRSLQRLLKVRGIDNWNLLGDSRPINVALPTLSSLPDRQLSSRQTSAAAGDDSTMEAPPVEQKLARPTSIDQPNAVGQPRPWADFLTTYQAERNVDFDGKPRVYLNQSDLRLLHRQVASAFDTQVANYIVRLRQYGPATGSVTSNDGDTRQRSSNSSSSSRSDSASDARRQSATVPPPDFSRVAQYSLTTPLDAVDSVVSWEQGEDLLTASSPMQTDVDAARIDQFCDRVTTTQSTIIRGRVDLLTAAPEVLIALPGIDEAVAQQILANRLTAADNNPPRTAAWLLQSVQIDVATLKQLWSKVTTRGDVLRTVVVAIDPVTSRWGQQEVVVDGTKPSLPLLLYRDLSRFGMLLPENWLASPPDGFDPGVESNQMFNRPTR